MFVNLSRPGFWARQDMPDDGDEWIGYNRMVEIVREYNERQAREEQENLFRGVAFECSSGLLAKGFVFSNPGSAAAFVRQHVTPADRFASCSKNEACTPHACEAGDGKWPRCPTGAKTALAEVSP